MSKKQAIAETPSTTKRLLTMATREENTKSEMSDSSAAESKNNDLNTMIMRWPLTTSSKHPIRVIK